MANQTFWVSTATNNDVPKVQKLAQGHTVVNPGLEQTVWFQNLLCRRAPPLFPKFHFLTLVPILKKTGIGMNGNEPQAMSKDLILDNGCVVVHQDLFHSHSWHLPNKIKSLTYKDPTDSLSIYSLPANIERHLFLKKCLMKSLQMNRRNAQEYCRKNKP